MGLELQDIALVAAGIIGSGVAVVHGVLTQRLMVNVIIEAAAHDRRFSGPISRLVPILLHFSTAVWFAGGIALIAAVFCPGREARMAISLLVGGAYLFGVIGNFWATRGRHPGWLLLAIACILIAAGTVGR